MTILWTVRVAVLATVLVFSVITLGLSADFVSRFTPENVPGIASVSQPAWAGLAVAVSVITLVAVTPMFVIDLLRRGPVTSWIIVEVAVFSVLTILWLATAADAAANPLAEVYHLDTLGLGSGCGAFDRVRELVNTVGGVPDLNTFNDELNDTKSLCHQQQATEAFAFMNWILLMAYTIALLVFAFTAGRRGNHNVWRSSVRDGGLYGQNGATGLNNVPLRQSAYSPTSINSPFGASRAYPAANPSVLEKHQV